MSLVHIAEKAGDIMPIGIQCEKSLSFDWSYFTLQGYNRMLEALAWDVDELTGDWEPEVFGFVCVGDTAYDFAVANDNANCCTRLQSYCFFQHPQNSLHEPYDDYYGEVYAYDDEFYVDLPDPAHALEKRCRQGISFEKFKQEFERQIYALFTLPENKERSLGERLDTQFFLKAMQNDTKFFQHVELLRHSEIA